MIVEKIQIERYFISDIVTHAEVTNISIHFLDILQHLSLHQSKEK